MRYLWFRLDATSSPLPLATFNPETGVFLWVEGLPPRLPGLSDWQQALICGLPALCADGWRFSSPTQVYEGEAFTLDGVTARLRAVRQAHDSAQDSLEKVEAALWRALDRLGAVRKETERITRVKAYREATGAGLKEALDAVDAQPWPRPTEVSSELISRYLPEAAAVASSSPTLVHAVAKALAEKEQHFCEMLEGSIRALRLRIDEKQREVDTLSARLRKHPLTDVLLKALEKSSWNEVAFTFSDGTEVCVQEMISLLQQQHPSVQEYLDAHLQTAQRVAAGSMKLDP